MKPKEHLVDAGYTAIETMLSSREQQGIDVIGPLKGGKGWQTTANTGFDISHFTIDFESQTATCPQGVKNSTWRESKSTDTIKVGFPKSTCLACPLRLECTKSDNGAKQLTVKTKASFEFMQQQEQREGTEEYKQKYAKRSGIEGTQSQATGTGGMRRSRYFGLAKTTLQNFIAAAAINFRRIAAFLDNVPLAKTRQTRFQKLAIA